MMASDSLTYETVLAAMRYARVVARVNPELRGVAILTLSEYTHRGSIFRLAVNEFSPQPRIIVHPEDIDGIKTILRQTFYLVDPILHQDIADCLEQVFSDDMKAKKPNAITG